MGKRWENHRKTIRHMDKYGKIHPFLFDGHFMKGNDGTSICEVCEEPMNQDIVNRLKGKSRGNRGF